jgi:hypothetical protein
LNTQSFKDRTLSTDAFKAWKSSLTDLGAQIIANKRYGMNAVRLEGCTVTCKRAEKPITIEIDHAEFDAHWSSILSVCQEFGFEPQ